MTSCSQSGLYAGVRRRDNTCRVTYSRESLETAHVVPGKYQPWFNKNNMIRYTYDAYNIINSANLFMLRGDIHTAYDAHKWTIAPKSSKWVFQHLDTAPELGSLFHNVELYPLQGLRTEYLFARFALAVFPMLNPFLANMLDKRLLGALAGTEDLPGKNFSGQWCLDHFPPPGTRSGKSSPTKNNKRAAPGDVEDIGRDATYESEDQLDTGRRSHKRRLSFYSGTGQDIHSFSDNQGTKRAKTEDPSSKIWVNPYLRGPCSCPEPSASPAAAASGSTNSKEGGPPALCPSDLKCYSQHCRTIQDLDRLELVRREVLREERRKSGVEGWWEEQLQWQKETSQGTVTEEKADRFRWMMGQEVLDDEGEYLDGGLIDATGWSGSHPS